MPLAVTYDNTKEMVHGKFNRKLKEASCQQKQMKLFTPWLNAAEREIKELKRGSIACQRDFGMTALNLSPT